MKKKRILSLLPWLFLVLVAASSGKMLVWNYIWDGSTWVKQAGNTSGNMGVILYDQSGNSATINNSGQLHTVMSGRICTNNSTTSVLSGAGVFTGIGTDISDYSAISLLVVSDVASATNGLSAEFSPDNSKWFVGEKYTVAAGATKFFTPPVQSKYFRMRYTNGAVAQTSFDLHVMLHKVPIKWSSHNLQDNLNDADDAELNISVLKLRTAQNNYVSGAATSNGNFKISLEEREATLVLDDMLEIARGNLTGLTAYNKYGLAPDGVQTTATDIWDRADAAATQQIWVAPTQARIHAIVSTSSADTNTTGASAWQLEVSGLTDWDTAEVTETINLNGTNPVNTVNSYVIIHRMEVVACGGTSVNAGVITATAATDGTITAQVNALQGQTQMAIYGIPSIQTAYMTTWERDAHNRSNPGTATEVDFSLYVNTSPDTSLACFKKKSNSGAITTGTGHSKREWKPYFKISGPAIIKIQGIASSADTEASSEFDIILVDN